MSSYPFDFREHQYHQVLSLPLRYDPQLLIQALGSFSNNDFGY